MNRGFVATRDRPLLERLAGALGAVPPRDELAALGRYLELVASWNKKLDLTAAQAPDALLEVMLGDALVLARPELLPHGARCVDVGSGAGAPAIPLALLRGDLYLVLVEPLRKRVAFLRTVLGTLQLVSRIQVLEQKLDPDAPALPPGSAFDVAMSRATFAPEVWLTAGLRLAPRTLVLLASQPPPTAPGARLARVIDYALPFSDAARRIAVYERA